MFLPKMSKKLPAIFIITNIVAFFILGLSSPADAGQSRSKSGRGKSARSSRVSSRTKIAHRGKQSRSHVQSEPLPPETYHAAPTYPDSIEVFEHGSSDSPILGRLLNMPNTTIAPTTGLDMTDPASQPKRLNNFRMESSRVSEIQQALASRGFYRGEPSGVYDDSTVEAMRRFQEKENIPITGYPTAHALRRLGLAKW